MINGLVGVLSRFQKEETEVTCDIEQSLTVFMLTQKTETF